MSLPVIVIVLVAGIGIASFFGNLAGLRDMFFPQTSASTEVSETITKSIYSQGVLKSADTTFSNRNIRINVRAGILNVLGHGASHQAEITIGAGVNLDSDALTVTALSEPNSYRVSLPPAFLVSCSLAPLLQYEQNGSLATNWNAVLDLANYAAMNEFVERAINSDLLSRAERNAERVVGDLVTAIDRDIKLEFEFQKAPNIVKDPTCQPYEPRDWVYNDTEDFWEQK